MIWCPNNGSICSERAIPMPNTAFLIASNNKIGVPRVQIEDTIKSMLRDKGVQLIFSSDYRKGDNILCKICKLAQQVQFGILIYDNKVQKRTIPNLFYESPQRIAVFARY